jgi:hypothetical protein
MGQEITEILDNDEVSLLETLDHVLKRGLVISGEITISIADIDLIYLGLNVILASVDTIDKLLSNRGEPHRVETGPGNCADNSTVDNADAGEL